MTYNLNVNDMCVSMNVTAHTLGRKEWLMPFKRLGNSTEVKISLLFVELRGKTGMVWTG